MYYVYLIRSKKNGRFYFGLTNNLRRRIAEHNRGKSYWTKRHAPFGLVYYEAYVALEDAKEREKKIKQFKKGYTELKKRLTYSIRLVMAESGDDPPPPVGVNVAGGGG